MRIFDFLKGDNKTAEEHFTLTTEKIQKELYNKAIPFYNKAIDKDLNYSNAYHDRGIAKDYVRDYFVAIKDFDTAGNLELVYAIKSAVEFNKSQNILT